jgi:5-(carboxyamino)imidazole ribonucleotide synthase
MNDSALIAPPATLGVLGGGQLGMMFAQAAKKRGYRVCVLDPDAKGPAAQVADEIVVANYDDQAALEIFARRCAAVTTEFENVPAQSLRWLSARVPVSPLAAAVAIAQDRRQEKAFFARHGLPIGPVVVIENEAFDASTIAFPAIIKTATLGYDGKGQKTVHSADEARAAWRSFGSVPCVLEQRIDLALEVSVIVARNRAGAVVSLPLQENQHRSGVLDVTIVPARVDASLAQRARALGEKVIAALDYVGVLCIEMFVTTTNQLLLNEIAPRPHNSGHYSIEACDMSQFDLQVLTMTNASELPMPQLHKPAVMVNVLGDCWAHGEPDWRSVRAVADAHIHLYGKKDAKPGRKMGHVTCVGDTFAQAIEAAAQVKRALRITP